MEAACLAAVIPALASNSFASARSSLSRRRASLHDTLSSLPSFAFTRDDTATVATTNTSTTEMKIPASVTQAVATNREEPRVATPRGLPRPV